MSENSTKLSGKHLACEDFCSHQWHLMMASMVCSTSATVNVNSSSTLNDASTVKICKKQKKNNCCCCCSDLSVVYTCACVCVCAVTKSSLHLQCFIAVEVTRITGLHRHQIFAFQRNIQSLGGSVQRGENLLCGQT